MNRPELLLIVCEGKTEVLYFSILQKRFRLPAWIRVIPELDDAGRTLGQHETLIYGAAVKKERLVEELNCLPEEVEVWAVCDRDEYKESFSKLKQYASERGVRLAFSDPQFENFLLQHFSANKSISKGREVMQEISDNLNGVLYKKNDLSWLDSMIDEKHSLVMKAVRNANNFTKHTRQPFFTVQDLVQRLLFFE